MPAPMRVLPALALVLLMTSPAMAQTMVEGRLTLGGKVVPLPPGQWRVLHLGSEPSRTREGDLPATLHRALLVQERDGKAAAVILATAATEVSTVWHPSGICTNANALVRQVEIAIRGNLDCHGLVNQGAGVGANTPDWLRSLYREGVDRPGWIPPRWIVGTVLLSERMHYLNVEYRYAPAVFGTGNARSAGNWSEGMRSPAQNDFLARITGFTSRAREELRRGLYGREPGAPLPSPF